MAHCPLGIAIPRFIRYLREGDVANAYQVIKEANWLPAVCGRICSAPCEAACVLNEEKAPIGIRALERYASDNGRARPIKAKEHKGKKIAVVGSGPAGLTAAAQLAQKGFQVTIFESLDRPGGILRYGIPEFRIPRKVLDQEINEIKALGVDIQTNIFIGQTITLDELKKDGYEAILLAMGAGIPKFMELRGAHLGGVYYGEEFLMRVNLTKSAPFGRNQSNFIVGKKVVVIGSGNTALDCARCARRLGGEVTLIFRRTEEEMYVRAEERDLAKEEGIHFEPLAKPVEILADQNHFVAGLKCVRMDYADAGGNNQWQLEPVPDSEFIIDVDTVVIAIGHRPNSLVSKLSSKLALNKDGTIKVDQTTFMTSVSGIFACGNVMTNAGPVVEAMASGKKAARGIEQFVLQVKK